MPTQTGLGPAGEQCDTTVPEACAPPSSLTERGMKQIREERERRGERKGRERGGVDESASARRAVPSSSSRALPNGIRLQPPWWKRQEWCSPARNAVRGVPWVSRTSGEVRTVRVPEEAERNWGSTSSSIKEGVLHLLRDHKAPPPLIIQRLRDPLS